MSRYVDGFVLPLAPDKLDQYKRIAQQAAEIWKEHGALDYWECVGDDLAEQEWSRAFPEMADAQEGETVIFAWVVFSSKEARDAANEKIQSDPRLAEMMDPNNPIFDCKRMAYGGFKELVSLKTS